MVFTSTIVKGLKATLNKVYTDAQNTKSELDYQDWCEEENQSDQWEEDVEYGGIGLAQERNEGEELSTADIQEGFTKRYIARNFGRRIVISEEALDDNKYPKIIAAASRLNRAGWLTVQYDSTSMLSRGFNSGFPGGDGVALWSASHTLPGGGTWSNLMATPMAPSVAALTTARTQVAHFPSQDGLLGAYQLKKVVFPTDQWDVWMGVLGSTLKPVAGNMAEINVARKMSIEPIEARFWTSTTTNYFFLTDADGGLRVRWRKRMRQLSWMEDSNLAMHYGIQFRIANGWTNARSTLGVNL